MERQRGGGAEGGEQGDRIVGMHREPRNGASIEGSLCACVGVW